MRSYPPSIHIRPKGALNCEVSVPGSKSLTNRALLIAALAEGRSSLQGALVAEDSQVMLQALQQLGIPVSHHGTKLTIDGKGGKIPARSASLDLRLSGTSIRFLTAMVCLGQGRYRLDGNARMRERPIADLISALRALGVTLHSEFDNGCPPLVVEAAGLPAGSTEIAGDRSSQYLSALLMSAPYAKGTVDIHVSGSLQSKPFIDMTLQLMEDFGVNISRRDYQHFRVLPSRYRARDYAIEGDAMAAGYMWAAAALSGGRVKVNNLGQYSCQGDKRLADVLAAMGCQVKWDAHSCDVQAGSALQGGRFDLNDMPDQAQTLAVLGMFCQTPVRIDNIWNLRIKETDRLHALHQELRKFGAQVEEGEDYIVVHPLEHLPQDPIHIETYGDHRMAMAFALAGLRLPQVIIHHPACVAKTFPDFFERLEALH